MQCCLEGLIDSLSSKVAHVLQKQSSEALLSITTAETWAWWQLQRQDRARQGRAGSPLAATWQSRVAQGEAGLGMAGQDWVTMHALTWATLV